MLDPEAAVVRSPDPVARTPGSALPL